MKKLLIYSILSVAMFNISPLSAGAAKQKEIGSLELSESDSLELSGSGSSEYLSKNSLRHLDQRYVDLRSHDGREMENIPEIISLPRIRSDVSNLSIIPLSQIQETMDLVNAIEELCKNEEYGKALEILQIRRYLNSRLDLTQRFLLLPPELRSALAFSLMDIFNNARLISEQSLSEEEVEEAEEERTDLSSSSMEALSRSLSSRSLQASSSSSGSNLSGLPSSARSSMSSATSPEVVLPRTHSSLLQPRPSSSSETSRGASSSLTPRPSSSSEASRGAASLLHPRPSSSSIVRGTPLSLFYERLLMADDSDAPSGMATLEVPTISADQVSFFIGNVKYSIQQKCYTQALSLLLRNRYVDQNYNLNLRQLNWLRSDQKAQLVAYFLMLLTGRSLPERVLPIHKMVILNQAGYIDVSLRDYSLMITRSFYSLPATIRLKLTAEMIDTLVRMNLHTLISPLATATNYSATIDEVRDLPNRGRFINSWLRILGVVGRSQQALKMLEEFGYFDDLRHLETLHLGVIRYIMPTLLEQGRVDEILSIIRLPSFIDDTALMLNLIPLRDRSHLLADHMSHLCFEKQYRHVITIMRNAGYIDGRNNITERFSLLPLSVKAELMLNLVKAIKETFPAANIRLLMQQAGYIQEMEDEDEIIFTNEFRLISFDIQSKLRKFLRGRH